MTKEEIEDSLSEIGLDSDQLATVLDIVENLQSELTRLKEENSMLVDLINKK